MALSPHSGYHWQWQGSPAEPPFYRSSTIVTGSPGGAAPRHRRSTTRDHQHATCRRALFLAAQAAQVPAAAPWRVASLSHYCDGVAKGSRATLASSSRSRQSTQRTAGPQDGEHRARGGARKSPSLHPRPGQPRCQATLRRCRRAGSSPAASTSGSAPGRWLITSPLVRSPSLSPQPGSCGCRGAGCFCVGGCRRGERGSKRAAPPRWTHRRFWRVRMMSRSCRGRGKENMCNVTSGVKNVGFRGPTPFRGQTLLRHRRRLLHQRDRRR